MGSTEAPQLKIVGVVASREVTAVLDRVEAAVDGKKVNVLQVDARVDMTQRAERNWRHLVDGKFGARARFVGLDIEAGANVDVVGDICAPAKALRTSLGRSPFDLVVCDRVLEHVKAPWLAAATVTDLLGPGGHLVVTVPWVQAHHAYPDDYWRMSFAAVMLLFESLEPVSLFYTGGAAGLDVAYRVSRGDRVEVSPAIGAVEQGLFQMVLDHDENRRLLEAQPGQRHPLSRAWLPTMFVNVVARKPAKVAKS